MGQEGRKDKTPGLELIRLSNECMTNVIVLVTCSSIAMIGLVESGFWQPRRQDGISRVPHSRERRPQDLITMTEIVETENEVLDYQLHGLPTGGKEARTVFSFATRLDLAIIATSCLAAIVAGGLNPLLTASPPINTSRKLP